MTGNVLDLIDNVVEEHEYIELIRRLFALYEAWNNADTYDPGDMPGITSLLGTEGAFALYEAWEAIEPHEERIRKLLAAPAEPVEDTR